MRQRLINFITVLAFGLTACTTTVPERNSDATAPIVARAPDASIIAIAGQGSGTVRVMFARNGGMVLIKAIRLPAGQTVTSLAVSADGRDLVIGTQSITYLASGGAWKLQAVAALSRAPLIAASRG